MADEVEKLQRVLETVAYKRARSSVKVQYHENLIIDWCKKMSLTSIGTRSVPV
jgi:cation transport regulator ChaB